MTTEIPTSTVRIELPYHLQTLARVGPEISLGIKGPVTAGSIVDAIESRYPMLCGTIRDHVTKQRRPFLRYFACQQDLSHEPPDKLLPAAIAAGTEPFIIWGALSGG
jgi:sulfur-carrier protein